MERLKNLSHNYLEDNSISQGTEKPKPRVLVRTMTPKGR